MCRFYSVLYGGVEEKVYGKKAPYSILAFDLWQIWTKENKQKFTKYAFKSSQSTTFKMNLDRLLTWTYFEAISPSLASKNPKLKTKT